MAKLEKNKILIAQDIDECLFNSVKKHHELLTEYGVEVGWINLPTYFEVCLMGGTHNAYGDMNGYWKKNEEMRDDPNFNRGQEKIEGSLDALLFLESILGIYLTTRPETLSRVTRDELVENGFPDREVVCRPLAIPLKKTSEWKLDVLKQMAKESGKVSLMIDDSVNLQKTILKAEDPNVGVLLFAGPMTPKGNGEKNWKEIKSMMKNKIL